MGNESLERNGDTERENHVEKLSVISLRDALSDSADLLQLLLAEGICHLAGKYILKNHKTLYLFFYVWVLGCF